VQWARNIEVMNAMLNANGGQGWELIAAAVDPAGEKICLISKK
jgi:hypothetical protein